MAEELSAAAGKGDRADWPPPQRTVADGEARAGAASGSGMPRWVKVFGIVAAILAVLIVVMLLTGHGPGRHMHGGLGRPTVQTGVAVAVSAGFDGHQL